MKRILVAGSTGYLGGYVVRELKKRGYWLRVLIRNENQKELFDDIEVDEFFIGQVTQTETLSGLCVGIDSVFSSIGITRQKDGLTYMDVDYQGNLNLLNEALRSEVNIFQYIAGLYYPNLKHLKVLEAKEKFVDDLKASSLPYSIVRPNGYFSDMLEFLQMAKRGRVYLFGNGDFVLNPIHGADLAQLCVDMMEQGITEASAGGPDMLSQNEIAKLALQAFHKPIKVTHLPDWLRKVSISLLRTLSNEKTYGPYEFFLSAMAQDNVADKYGTHHLVDFFNEEAKQM